MHERPQEIWTNVTHAVTEMRNGASLAAAARRFRIDRRIVVRLGRPALRKDRSGKWVARPHDRLLRVLVVPTSDGLQEIAVHDSREATKVAEYWDKVERQQTPPGDASGLRRLRYKTVKLADGKRFRLLTDLTELDRLGNAGVFSFESLYARSA
jgi:hypothetical protein